MILFHFFFSCSLLCFLNPFLRLLFLPWVDLPAAHMATPGPPKKPSVWS